MSSNLKRAIRERMKEAGETYSTARMHILREREQREGEDAGSDRDPKPRG